MRYARAVAATGVLLFLLAGFPLTLAAIIGDPRPGWADLGVGDLSDTALLDVLATVVWVAWAHFAASVLAETARLVRARSRPVRVPVTAGPNRSLARVLLASVVLALPLAGPAQAMAAGPPGPATTLAAPAQPCPHLAGLRTDVGVPAAAASADTAARTRQDRLVYVVADGDRLGSIAQRFLGDFWQYPRIREANTALIPSTSGRHGPDYLRPGWKLTLPARALDLGRRPHATGTTHLVAGERHRDPGRNPGRTPPTAPTPSPTPTPTPDRTVSPSRPAPTSPPPASVTAPPPARERDSPGVTVPGGWMDLPLAAAIVGAVAAVWIRRRMTYLYPPFDEDPLTHAADEDDLDALPVVVTRLRQAVREYGAHLPDAFPGPREHPGHPDQLRTTPTRAVTALAAPATGMGLIGPGAGAAARALLVSALTGHRSETPHERGEVIISRAAWDSLLPGFPTPAGFAGRLRIGDDQDDILALLRHRLSTPASTSPVGPEPPAPGTLPSAGPLLFLTNVPPGPERAQLLRILDGGGHQGLRTVLLGDWTPGPTLRVDSDGHTESSSANRYPDRVAVLDPTSTVAILNVLDHPAGTTHPPISTPEQPVSGPGERREAVSRPDRGIDRTLHDERPAPRVPVTLLGPPAVRHLNGTPVRGLRRHASELLVYLGVHREGARLPEIMEALWPDATMRRAQQRLSTEVANLRRTIRTAADDSTLQSVVNTGGHYHLDPTTVDIDIWRLQDYLDAAAASTDAHQRRTHLQAALDVPADLLARDSDYDWIEAPREHLRRQRIRALLALAGDPDSTPETIAALCSQAADLDPASEDLARRAMRAHATLANTNAVTDRLDHLRAVLAEIGEQPSTETLNLAAELITAKPVASR